MSHFGLNGLLIAVVKCCEFWIMVDINGTQRNEIVHYDNGKTIFITDEIRKTLRSNCPISFLWQFGFSFTCFGRFVGRFRFCSFVLPLHCLFSWFWLVLCSFFLSDLQATSHFYSIETHTKSAEIVKHRRAYSSRVFLDLQRVIFI